MIHVEPNQAVITPFVTQKESGEHIGEILNPYNHEDKSPTYPTVLYHFLASNNNGFFNRGFTIDEQKFVGIFEDGFIINIPAKYHPWG